MYNPHINGTNKPCNSNRLPKKTHFLHNWPFPPPPPPCPHNPGISPTHLLEEAEIEGGLLLAGGGGGHEVGLQPVGDVVALGDQLVGELGGEQGVRAATVRHRQDLDRQVGY